MMKFIEQICSLNVPCTWLSVCPATQCVHVSLFDHTITIGIVCEDKLANRVAGRAQHAKPNGTHGQVLTHLCPSLRRPMPSSDQVGAVGLKWEKLELERIGGTDDEIYRTNLLT